MQRVIYSTVSSDYLRLRMENFREGEGSTSIIRISLVVSIVDTGNKKETYVSVK